MSEFKPGDRVKVTAKCGLVGPGWPLHHFGDEGTIERKAQGTPGDYWHVTFNEKPLRGLYHHSEIGKV